MGKSSRKNEGRRKRRYRPFNMTKKQIQDNSSTNYVKNTNSEYWYLLIKDMLQNAEIFHSVLDNLDKKIVVIGTHSGTQHCDEIVAVMMLKILFPDAVIVRTRKEEELAKCTIVVDVGGEYDPKNLRFDHHQRGFGEKIEGYSTKLSSIGLIYKHYGEQVIKKLLSERNINLDEKTFENLYQIMYKVFVEHIDANDNGICFSDKELEVPILSMLPSRVKLTNLKWNEDSTSELQNSAFKSGLILVFSEFVRVLDIELKKLDREVVQNKFSASDVLSEVILETVFSSFSQEKYSSTEVWKQFGCDFLSCKFEGLNHRDLEKVRDTVEKYTRHIDFFEDQEFNFTVSTALPVLVRYSESYTDAKNEVLNQFMQYLSNQVKSWLPARSLVEEAFTNKIYDDQVIILKQYCPWPEHLVNIEIEHNQEGKIKFVLYKDQAGTWRIQAVSLQPGSFENRLSLPKSWCGLKNKQLDEVCGVPDCTFVHNNGFIGGNNTFKGALQMAKLAIEFYKTIILYMGVPGCGKSTHAESLSTNLGYEHIEADRLHVIDDIYKFDQDKVRSFHKQIIEECEKLMEKGQGVIVPHTNLTPSAMKPYFLRADKYNYKVIILYPKDFSSDENPIWVNGELNSDLIYQRRELSSQHAGKQFTNKEKKLPKHVLDFMMNKFYENVGKMTRENILSAQDFKNNP